MRYLHDDHIRQIGIDWAKLCGIVRDVLAIKDQGDSAHPLKPYLRFRDLSNRIIAMPAYVGGNIDMAGIKWIASFPANPERGLPRANNTIILNDPGSGEPLAFIHSGLLNGLRTAAVSGVMLTEYMNARELEAVRLGVIGWGPIARLHLAMCIALLGERLERVCLYDVRGIDPATIPAEVRGITDIAADWRYAYRGANVVATCTVSPERYIDEAPSEGALLLNVSLRDYLPASVVGVTAVVVDDWREVCRENTDIELLHRASGLQEQDVSTLADVALRGRMRELAGPVFFNPMGLGVFDIAIAGFYFREAERLKVGVPLPRSER
ncbi:2,3-diaminopropionate biosynthesis protein SbnB [Paenibacillus oryzisoli]|uniref:2,3-diaminopropionate biosynthesis protein SbnB n=1 Tax=Paenibacillus oryzisoli TaxID=1850517 RepID=UPI003D287FB0